MRYTDKSFTVGGNASQKYRDNYDKVFKPNAPWGRISAVNHDTKTVTIECYPTKQEAPIRRRRDK